MFNTLAPQSEQQYLPYLLTALPVCLVSFGFHGNVPSLVKYYHRDGDRVMKAIFIGTGLALIIYILWQLAIQGNLPRAEFAPVIEKGGDVSALLEALRRYIETDYIAVILNFFAYMAIASSFLGVTLGLFDYIADLFKFDDSVMGRTKTTLVTFLPPPIIKSSVSLWFCGRHWLCRFSCNHLGSYRAGITCEGKPSKIPECQL